MILANRKYLEELLANIPRFPATITGVLESLSPPLLDFINFKYDNSEIKGDIVLPTHYTKALMADCGVANAFELKDAKIMIYTPSIDSGKIYAIKNVNSISQFDKFNNIDRF